MLRLVLQVVFALALLSSAAHAEDARRAGTVRLQPASGGRGPIVLQKDGADYAGELVIVNDGKEPLVVSRIAVRGDAADPRVPPKLVAKLADGSVPITIPPGASRRAAIRWSPEPAVRQRQLFGHVVVTTSDESAGEVAMGVRAQLGGALGFLDAHAIPLMMALPLLAAVAALLLTIGARAGAGADRAARVVTIAALAAQTLLAVYVYAGFVPDVSRADGNDGLQFVERVVWSRALGAELYLGVDGIAAASLLVTSGLALLAALPRGRGGEHRGALLVLDAALIGALASMDGLVFLLFSSAVVASAAMLVRSATAEAGRAVAVRVALPGAAAVLLLAIALSAAARHADPTFLVDGTKVATTFNLPELSRVALGAKGATLLGGALERVCFVLVLVASMLLLAVFPAHRWLGDVLAEVPPATGMLVAIALPTLGLCALLRVGCAVLPDGMRWASGVVVALGAVSAAYGALLALGQSDLRRLAACATTTQAGFVLLGAGSLTPQGLSGAIVVGTTRALACGVFLLVVGAMHERARTCELSRLRGAGSRMPGWAAALAVAALAQAGVLGLGGAWGPVLATIGVLSSYAPLAIVAAIGLVLVAAAHVSAAARVALVRIVRGASEPEPSAPADGALADLSSREWACIAPPLAIVLLLGVWPAPVTSVTTGTVRDLANAVSPPGPDQVASL